MSQVAASLTLAAASQLRELRAPRGGCAFCTRRQRAVSRRQRGASVPSLLLLSGLQCGNAALRLLLLLSSPPTHVLHASLLCFRAVEVERVR